MVQIHANGAVELVTPPANDIGRRQDAPPVYDVTTVAYAVDPTFIFTHSSTFSGRVRAVQVPVERAIDIDTLLDFEIAEFLMERRNRFSHGT
jgi:N-acylneuraminate cytidylyltransferase